MRYARMGMQIIPLVIFLIDANLCLSRGDRNHDPGILLYVRASTRAITFLHADMAYVYRLTDVANSLACP